MSTATETSYTGTFHGRAEEVSRVRRQVARYLGDCPGAASLCRGRRAVTVRAR